MQPAPSRFLHVIRATFRSAKPLRQPTHWPQKFPGPKQDPQSRCLHGHVGARAQLRLYSDRKNDLESKVEDAKKRIKDSIDARADHVDTELSKSKEDLRSETIVHTNPEASSIVHARTSTDSGGTKSRAPAETPLSDEDVSSLPSQKPLGPLTKRFSHIMDNLQSNIFTASQHLNDLTGYSGIEKLKQKIEEEETNLVSARRALKENRQKYADAISTRSTTQREVNDLLQRKHGWSPEDLERFTSLYRSDHANEQAEIAAHELLSRSESAYEEVSTKLARTILARYHEEQIWSDKIRQMSTWGTWGLMGLNILLFILFQIAIEPWRRRRLVRGFEEKVQEALSQQHTTTAAAAAAGNVPDAHAQDVADTLAESIVDAVAGATDDSSQTGAESQLEVEAAIEAVQEAESGSGSSSSSSSNSDVAPITGEISPHLPDDPSFPVPVIDGTEKGIADAQPSLFTYYQEAFRDMFSERPVMVSQRELTTVAMEGVVGGAAVMGLLIVLLRPR